MAPRMIRRRHDDGSGCVPKVGVAFLPSEHHVAPVDDGSPRRADTAFLSRTITCQSAVDARSAVVRQLSFSGRDARRPTRHVAQVGRVEPLPSAEQLRYGAPPPGPTPAPIHRSGSASARVPSFVRSRCISRAMERRNIPPLALSMILCTGALPTMPQVCPHRSQRAPSCSPARRCAQLPDSPTGARRATGRWPEPAHLDTCTRRVEPVDM